MVIDLGEKQNDSRFSEQDLRIKQYSRNVESELVRMALLADVQLMLKYVRHPTPDGFNDSLSLELSDDVKAEPFRHKALEEVHLTAVGFTPHLGGITYSRLAGSPYREHSGFYKREGSHVYVANLQDVVLTGKDLISKVESILESRWLVDVSVQGLDYFFPAQTDGFSEFPFKPYFHTSYKDTHGFKDWLSAQERKR